VLARSPPRGRERTLRALSRLEAPFDPETTMQSVKTPMPAAQAVSLADLVQYAEGSIVSRAIAQKPVGSLTLFAFDEGQALSEHTAPFDALVQVLDGAAELTIGGMAVQAEAGQSVLMPANIPHAVTARRRFKMLLSMIRG
jgi:quercetin dioxygenase-like cupin family protein